jgi:hypothetical protein
VPELSGLNTDYSSLSLELQEKMQKESDLLSVAFPDQTIVLLANTLSGITAMLNYSQLTANLNNFLPFAFLKTAGYAIAATLGVAPRRKMGAQMWVRLRPPGTAAIDFTGQLDANLTIPAYTQFRCRNTIWHTRENYILHPTDPYADVKVYEGRVFVEEFDGLGEKYQRWFIGTPFALDNDSIRVMVNDDWWEEAFEGSFVYYGPANTVFIQQTAPDGKVLIFFGNGIYGRVPPRGSSIKIFYTETLGFAGNNASVGDGVDLLDSIAVGPGQILGVDGITVTVASGGEDEHTLDDIKYVIPRLYAANNRAVRRDDYIGHLLGAKAPLGFADARVWGEYEEAYKQGIGKLEMMNRAYWTGILRSFHPTHDENLHVVTGGGESVFSFPLTQNSLIKGSLNVLNTDNDIIFNDSQGNGILVSPDMNFNGLTGGTIIASSAGLGTSALDMRDDNIETYWASASAPSPSEPVRVDYDMGLGNSIIPKAFRIRSSNDYSREQRAFPKIVSIWGSNTVPPQVDELDDWEPIRGSIVFNDPGIATWSPWVTFDNPTAYRYVRLKIEDRYGSQGFTKICEWQVLRQQDASTINYNTMQVTMKYPVVLSGGTLLDAHYYGPELSVNQIAEVDIYLKKFNHFTTLLTYSPPIMKRIDIEVEIYYFSEYDENKVSTEVDTKLTDLFFLQKGSIGRTIAHSDLMKTVLEVEGVDYAIFLTPQFGGDLQVGLGEFLYDVDNRISLYVSARSQQFNRYGIDR